MLKARKKFKKKELKKDPFFEKIDQGVRLYNKKKNVIFSSIGVFIVIILIIYGFNYMNVAKDNEAAGKFGIAQQYLEKSLNDRALEAFNELLNVYSGTQYGQLANYYLGYIYLNQMDYLNAKNYLENYLNKNDKNKMFVESALVGLAVIEASDGNNNNAAEYYIKASDMSKTQSNQVTYLIKAAKQYLKINNFDKVNPIIEKLGTIDDLTQLSKDQLEALKCEFELLAK